MVGDRDAFLGDLYEDKLGMLKGITEGLISPQLALLDGDEAVIESHKGWCEVVAPIWRVSPWCDGDERLLLRCVEVECGSFSIMLGMPDLVQALNEECLEVPQGGQRGSIGDLERLPECLARSFGSVIQGGDTAVKDV